jgi:hypothetical protein
MSTCSWSGNEQLAQRWDIAMTKKKGSHNDKSNGTGQHQPTMKGQTTTSMMMTGTRGGMETDHNKI